MQSGVKIILVETSHPGNIGSAARALKTMGQMRLCLVNPKEYPSAEATALASGADDVLAQAQVFSSVADAVADCTFCFGVSARQRSLPLPALTPKMAAKDVQDMADKSAVAILFGRERVGLTNEEIDCCHALISISANPVYSSLNLAMAVQIVAYELWQAEQQRACSEEQNQSVSLMATGEEMHLFYQHLESTLIKTEFLEPEKPKFLMRRLKRLFNRSQPDKNEINILRGFLTSIEKSIREK